MDGITYNLLIVEGKPTWIQQREWGSLGAAGPGGTRAEGDHNLVDGAVLGRAAPKTDTAEEITMADAVRSTGGWTSGRRSGGGQERFKAKLRDQYLEGKGVDASQALAEAMGSIQEAANKRTQDTNQAWMLNHTLQPLQALERGLFCPLELDDIPQMGDIKEKYVPYIRMLRASQNPWNQEALLEEMPDLVAPAFSRVPLDLEDGKLSLILWAMKRHQGELRMFGGIWKKHARVRSPGARTRFKLAPDELLALERRTHPLTCEWDHIDPVIYTALDSGGPG